MSECTGGARTLLEVPVPTNPCECVGIASVVFNPDYTLTVTLTDGTSYTSADLRGADGSMGATGATGNTGAAGSNGTNGTNGADGLDGIQELFSNQQTDTVGANVRTSFTNKQYVLPLATLVQNGDKIIVESTLFIEGVEGLYGFDLLYDTLFLGSSSGTDFQFLTTGVSNWKIKFKMSIIRLTATTARIEFDVRCFENIAESANSTVWNRFGYYDIVSPSFDAANINIQMQALEQSTGEDISCNLMEVTYYKKQP